MEKLVVKNLYKNTKEYETLKSDAEQIRKIEEEIAALPTDSSEEQTSDASGTAFPQFEGKDLDGNKVDSSVFAENAVTVVNFWFNECKPCVEELSEMNGSSKIRWSCCCRMRSFWWSPTTTLSTH